MNWIFWRKPKPTVKLLIRRSHIKIGEYFVFRRTLTKSGWCMINIGISFASEHDAEKHVKEELALEEWVSSGKDVEFY